MPESSPTHRSAVVRQRPDARTPSVLSASDIAAIEHRARRQAAADSTAAFDFDLGPDGPVFGMVPLRALPAEWTAWGLDPGVAGIGLCLPVAGAGHLGVAMRRNGEATWFSIDHGVVQPNGPASCRLLDDVCRSRLGLTTQAPGSSPDWYWLGVWLADVAGVDEVDASSFDDQLVDVVSVARMHPAMELEDLNGFDMHALAGFMVERHRAHVAIADWACIRLDAIADPSHAQHQLATALDLGAFSRWVSASSPALSDLAARLTARCSPLALRLIGAVVSDILLRHRIDSPR